MMHNNSSRTMRPLAILCLALMLGACGGGGGDAGKSDGGGHPATSSPSHAGHTGGSSSPSGPPAVTPPAVVQPGTPDEILAMINQARSVPRFCGTKSYPAVAPLVWSHELAAASVAHAQDMADRQYFGHTALAPAPYGADFSQRAAYFQYPHFARSENIAAGQKNIREAIDDWIKSPGHCQNLMDASATQVGMGYGFSAGNQYRRFWVQMFGIN